MNIPEHKSIFKPPAQGLAPFYIPFKHRKILALQGQDRKTFLQGLITNDIFNVSSTQTLYTGFLTPQGKYLNDFFIIEREDVLYLEGEEGQGWEDLQKRLKMLRLRACVEFEDVSDLYISFAILGNFFEKFGFLPQEDSGATRLLREGWVFIDPRCKELGLRGVIKREAFDIFLKTFSLVPASFKVYEYLRLSLGIPDGSRDLIRERSIVLEGGFEDLKALNFQKGCYMGQELVSRTKYRGLVRKRLMPVVIAKGQAPNIGTPLYYHDQEAGEMRTSLGEKGIAMIRIEAFEKYLIEKQPFVAGESHCFPYKPDWMILASSQT